METDSKTDKKNLIFGKYRLTKIIGTGSFGNVYQGKNIINNKNVAIKVEKKNNEMNLLEKESFYLYSLKGIGIPEVISFGYCGNYNILVQTLLGESLGNIFFSNNFFFSLKDICMFTIQILQRIEYVHSKYIIHRDIKPENFLIGEPDKYLIYLIDFGLSKKYKSSRTNKHVKFQLTKKFTGTARYASINSIRGVEQSRRDDLEAVGYMLLYFLNRGNLPWKGISCKERADKYYKIYQMKKNLNYDIFCKNMPKEIIAYIKYCRALKFEQRPDYGYLRSLFQNILKKNGLYNDLHFSWIKDLSILKNNDNRHNIISQLNLGKRRKSPQCRIIKKLESFREAAKEIKNADTKLKGNNSVKNKDNILILKTKSYIPKFIINKRLNNTLKRSVDSDNYKSNIAQYNISLDYEDQITDKTSINKKYENFLKSKDFLNINRESLLENRSTKNNNSLYYFSGNFTDLSKSFALTGSNNKYGINKFNSNNHLNEDNLFKQNSSFFMSNKNRFYSSNSLNKNQNRNLNSLNDSNVKKSLNFMTSSKPPIKEIKEAKENEESLNIANAKNFFMNNNSSFHPTISAQNIFKSNNNDSIKKNFKNKIIIFKNKYDDIKINSNNNNNTLNNNIKKQNTSMNMNNRKNIGINNYHNNKNNINKSMNINNIVKKIENNKNMKKNSNKKIIKKKVKNLTNINNNNN
jgi:casein kinase 1